MNLFGHGGGVKGVSSYMLVAQEQGITVAVLTNIAEVSAEDMAMTSIDYLLNLKEEQVESAQSEFQLSEEQLSTYAGIYESAEGHKVNVSVQDGALRLLINNNELRIIPYAENRFITADRKKVTFIVNDYDEVTGVFRGMRFIPKVDG